MARFLLTRDLNTHHHLLFSFLIFFHLKQLYYKTKNYLHTTTTYFYIYICIEKFYTHTCKKHKLWHKLRLCKPSNYFVFLLFFTILTLKGKYILNMSFFFFLQLLFLFVWKCRDRGGVWLMSCRDITL